MLTCKVDGCDKKHDSHGYCGMHNQRIKRTGGLTTSLKYPTGTSLLPEYKLWRAMKNRCNLPSQASYKYYGARGISVCKRWDVDFLSFYSDMGERPFQGAQIDRIDNDKDYSPDNCRWVTPAENVRNSPRVKLNPWMAKTAREMIKRGIPKVMIGTAFGVTKENICSINANKTWRDI